MNSKRMKVAILAPLPPPTGGIGTWALRVAKALPAFGCDVVLVDEGLIGGREFFGEKAKKKILQEWKRCRIIWNGLRTALEDLEVQIVHTNIPASLGGMMRELVCLRIAKGANRRFIVHFHCTLDDELVSTFQSLLIKVICSHADGVITLNEKSRNYVTQTTGKVPWMVPNFITASEISVPKSHEGPVHRVLFVGGVCEDKGIKDFFAVAQRFPGVEFMAIGRIEKGVADVAPANVILTGPLDHSDIASALAEADVFFFLSHYRFEGFSVALTEAMAAGLPCVVTDWAANADMVGDGGGFVVQPGDIDACERALKILDDSNIRACQGKRNIAKVKNEYFENIVLEQIIGLYSETVGIHG